MPPLQDSRRLLQQRCESWYEAPARGHRFPHDSWSGSGLWGESNEQRNLGLSRCSISRSQEVPVKCWFAV